MFQIGQKKFLWLKKVKNTVSWTFVVSDSNGEETVGMFYEKKNLKSKSRVQSWKTKLLKKMCTMNWLKNLILLIPNDSDLVKETDYDWKISNYKNIYL